MALKPKILITGARSYIGSRFLLHAKKNGCDVFGLTRQPHADFIQGDLADRKRISEILNEIKPDIVIHCAGVTPHNKIDNDLYKKTNVEASKNLVQAMIDTGRDVGLVNCSSLSVYGYPKSPDGIVSEDDACEPLSPYGQSKLDFENYLKAQSNIRFVNLRIANIPGKDGFLSHVITCKHYISYGDTPYIRDFIHPDDLNDLMLRSVNYLYTGGHSITLNAGSGCGVNFDECVSVIENKTGWNINKEKGCAKSNDIITIICDISVAKSELGFVPIKNNLDDIIDYALQNTPISVV